VAAALAHGPKDQHAYGPSTTTFGARGLGRRRLDPPVGPAVGFNLTDC